VAAGLAAVGLLCGCGPARGPAPSPPAAALGPADVIAAHNAWADSIERVWSRAAIYLSFPTGEPNKARLQQDLDGHLFVVKPDRLFLHGQILGQEIFTIGMNPDKYWLWVRPQVDTVWVGKRGGPGERRFIVSPEDLMSALGIFRIDLGAGGMAAFTAQRQHYLLSEDRRFGSGRAPVRRVWFDPRTLRPVRVDLYDGAGKCILMAEMMRYEKAGPTDVCTVYRARFYGDAEVALVLRLSAVSLEKAIKPQVFECRVSPGATVKDIDKDD
jgi:hypothetical protein